MHFGATMWFTEYSISPSRLAIALEERGFESLWASEHSHLRLDSGDGEPRSVQADVMDPFLTLTTAALSTTALRLGTGICLVNQRDPIQTARLVASIDQLSDGRFLFGIGNGWHEDRDEEPRHGLRQASPAGAAAAQIHAKIEAKLIKHARKHGLTEAEGIALTETVKASGDAYEAPQALCKEHGS